MKALAALLALGITMPFANISGVLSGGNAHLNVRFAAEGENVQIKLVGGQGLKVVGDATPIKNRSVSKGERITLDIDYQQGPDQSTLSVEVTGKFGGESKSVSQVFNVGIPNDDQRHRAHDRATSLPKNQELRVKALLTRAPT